MMLFADFTVRETNEHRTSVSTVGMETGYTDRVFLVFSGLIPRPSTWQPSGTSLPIHYSLVNVLFELVHSQLFTASVNFTN
jgi:hypothetical protein